MPKQIDLSLKARTKLLYGARLLAKTVSATYGPKGRTVMLDRMAGLLATKDGVTVAREISLSDPVANMGAEIVKAACVQVNNEVGDGTTSAAILAAVLLEESHRLVVAGHDPMTLFRDISASAERAVEVVRDLAIRVESQIELERVAHVASNGDDDVAKALAEACMAVGKDGTISIEDGHGLGIELVYKDGMEIDSGVSSAAFLRDSGGVERVMESPLVAVIGSRLQSVADVQEIMETASQWPDHPLLVIAGTIEGPALTTMLVNDSQNVVKCCAVNAPGFGDKKVGHLRDLAALAGATYIDPDIGMDFRKGFDPEWFGSYRRATVKTRSAMFLALDEANEVIAERIEELKREGVHLDSDYDQDRLSERIAKLSGGLCIMHVGGSTEPELKERRGRVEDALGAVRGALEEGVVPGAGTAYLEASEHLSVESPRDAHGWHIMAKALRAPLLKLADNAGKEGSSVAHAVSEARQADEYGWVGWDANTDTIRDLGDEPPILDPVAVTVSVIRAGASVAATLLTAEVSISEKKA
jgi:chaperonin GroEL